MKKLLRVVRKPTGGGGFWYDYQYSESGANKMSYYRVARKVFINVPLSSIHPMPGKDGGR